MSIYRDEGIRAAAAHVPGSPEFSDEALDNALYIVHCVAPEVLMHFGYGWCPRRISESHQRLAAKGLLVRQQRDDGAIVYRLPRE